MSRSQQQPVSSAIGKEARDPGSLAGDANRLAANIATVIKGKPEVIKLALTCFFAEGHLLIEDVPGLGKTSLARALSASIHGSWRRIQFTPDLLPSDVTGVTIFNQGSRTFEFHPGGVFANIVVADEINRASPKTQSALLEVMEERQVTVDSVPHPVPRPFIVVATQNPIEMDGTYRLPEAQLDRFLMRVSVGYPDADAERAILVNHLDGKVLTDLPPVLSTDRVSQMITETSRVHVADALHDYIIAIGAATRVLPEIRLGVSPRGSIALLRAARALAALSGRSYAVPEDVKGLAESVLSHRLILQPEAELRGVTPQSLIGRVLDAVPSPIPQTV
ncbi:MAG: MoxR family ATPase [Actinomycetota bacterium]|jgi:MoxR-like ATPase|nr:MoxR family ATPase [Actinomycetota bacterium]